MHEWLSGGVSPCQGEGRGFESRLVLLQKRKKRGILWDTSFLSFTLRDVSFSHTKSKRTSSFSHIIKVIESMMCVFFILSI